MASEFVGAMPGSGLTAAAIDDLTEVTPAAGDFLVIVDATDGELKKIDADDVMDAGGIPNRPVIISPTVGNSNSVANTTTETPFDKVFTIPANTLRVGDLIRLRTKGVFSTNGTPTIFWILQLNGGACFNQGQTAPDTVTNQHWHLDAEFLCTAIGAAGTLIPLHIQAGYLGATTGSRPDFNSHTVDTTVNIVFRGAGDWGTASASNTITQTAAFGIIEGTPA
jgi:hypothetical protein